MVAFKQESTQIFNFPNKCQRLNNNLPGSIIYQRSGVIVGWNSFENDEYAPYPSQNSLPISLTFKELRQLTDTCRKESN